MNTHCRWPVFALLALAAAPAAAQTPAQRGRGGVGSAPQVPAPLGGVASEAGGRGGPGVAAQFGGGDFGGGDFGGGFGGGRGGLSGARSRGSAILEKVPEAVENFYRDFDERSLDAIPPRQYEVKVASEPVRTRLFRADPKLLENKFVARFVVLAAGVDPADQRSVQQFNERQTTNNNMQRTFPEPLKALTTWGEGSHLFQDGSFMHRDKMPLHEFHKLLAQSCPAAQRPAERVLAFLTSAECDRDVARRDLDRDMRVSGQLPGDERIRVYDNLAAWEYKLYAPTREEAELRVAAILRLLDAGMCRPLQRYLLSTGRESLDQARQAQTAVAATNDSIRTEEEKLARPSEISTDILTQLKAQKVMVAVELAGLIARVKACDDMLKDPKRLEISTLQSISDMKVKAEIERVGIKEKLDQINRFIAEGDGREAATSRLTTLQNEKRSRQQALLRSSSMAQACAALIELYAPLQVGGNEVTISPIEWTN